MCEPIWSAASNRKWDLVHELVQKGAGVNLAGGRGRRTALHHAAQAGELATVHALLAAKAKLDRKDAYGFSPLHVAAAAGHAEIVAALLQAGTAANLLNEAGGTPLHAGILCADRGVPQLLLGAGADPRLGVQQGVRLVTPLYKAVASADALAVEVLLEHRGPSGAPSLTPRTVGATHIGLADHGAGQHLAQSLTQLLRVLAHHDPAVAHLTRRMCAKAARRLENRDRGPLSVAGRWSDVVERQTDHSTIDDRRLEDVGAQTLLQWLQLPLPAWKQQVACTPEVSAVMLAVRRQHRSQWQVAAGAVAREAAREGAWRLRRAMVLHRRQSGPQH